MKREKWKSKKLINYSFVSSEFKCTAKFDVRYHIVKFVKSFGSEENRKCKTNFFSLKMFDAFKKFEYHMGKVSINLSSSDIIFLTIYKYAKL